MSRLFASIRSNRSGATAIEYGLIAAPISVALIAGASSLGDALNSTFANLANNLANVSAF